MNENGDEKDRIVIGDDSCIANDHAPTEGHDPVGDVVRFARVPPPTINQKAIAMSSLDVLWILESTPGQLREGVAELGDTLSLHFETALLRHRGVPDVVGSEQCSE